MPRPPKKAVEAPKVAAAAPPRVIDVDNFIRVRDSVSANTHAFFTACLDTHARNQE